MLPTTLEVIKAGLKADPTVSPADRSSLLAMLKQRPATPKPAPESPFIPRIVRRKEAASRLGLSLRSIDKLARDGILQKRVLPGRVRGAGFVESDLLALIAGKAPL